ncbi:hypothetical protein AHF37_05960 [Paragonimus kellicotti]|nr:hypothetical protein AHF37_05960 [Paragonimus kellicotti]
MVSMLSVTPTQMELFAISKTPAILRLRSYLSTFICLLFMFVLMVCGLVCLSTLAGCDVKLARLIKHRDQLFPFTLVVLFDEVIGVRGLLFGLFVACALNCGLCPIGHSIGFRILSLTGQSFQALLNYGCGMWRTGFCSPFSGPPRAMCEFNAVAFALLAIPLAFGFCHSPVSLFKLSLTTAAGASACLLASCLLGAVMSVLTIHFGSAQSNVLQHTSVENCIQFASDLKIGLEMPKNQSLENTLSGPVIFTLSYIYFAGLFITFGLLIALVVSVLPGRLSIIIIIIIIIIITPASGPLSIR